VTLNALDAQPLAEPLPRLEIGHQFGNYTGKLLAFFHSQAL
jgi:hypothetical protein